MKYSILLFSVLVLFGCSTHPNGQTTSSTIKRPMDGADSLQAIIDANINKSPSIDTIISGFAFGMSKDAFLEHMRALIKQKKMIKDDANQSFEIPLDFDLFKVNAGVAPQFINGKLYELSLLLRPVDDMVTQQEIYTQACSMYMRKYSSNTQFTSFQEQGVVDPSTIDYHWIKNNLHISIEKFRGLTTVDYVDLPGLKAAKKVEAVSADSAKKQTQKNI